LDTLFLHERSQIYTRVDQKERLSAELVSISACKIVRVKIINIVEE
jgi:hypothetical protein